MFLRPEDIVHVYCQWGKKASLSTCSVQTFAMASSVISVYYARKQPWRRRAQCIRIFIYHLRTFGHSQKARPSPTEKPDHSRTCSASILVSTGLSISRTRSIAVHLSVNYLPISLSLCVSIYTRVSEDHPQTPGADMHVTVSLYPCWSSPFLLNICSARRRTDHNPARMRIATDWWFPHTIEANMLHIYTRSTKNTENLRFCA